MKKSFLKTSIVNTSTTVDKDSGEVLEQDVQTVKYLANNKEEFFIVYSSLIGLIQKEMTGPEIKVYAYILEHYLLGSEIALPKALKQNIAVALNLKLGTVNNVLSGLCEKKLIYSNQRAIYKINPRYAFKGSTKDRNAMLKVILELECPNC